MYTFSNYTSPTQCINITIIDDNIVEATETISFQLYTLDFNSSQNVLFTEQEICTIFIEDNGFVSNGITIIINPQIILFCIALVAAHACMYA